MVHILGRCRWPALFAHTPAGRYPLQSIRFVLYLKISQVRGEPFFRIKGLLSIFSSLIAARYERHALR